MKLTNVLKKPQRRLQGDRDRRDMSAITMGSSASAWMICRH